MNKKRDVVSQIIKNSTKDEVLLLVGPRQVGKTTALHQVEAHLKKKGKTTYFLNLEDPDYLSLLKQSPKNIFQIFPIDLNQKNYLFIDEIQYLDDPSNFLKYIFDEYKGKIKIFASGSSAFYLDQKFKDSLAGRKKLLNIYTFSFKEFVKFKHSSKLAKKDFTKLTLSEIDTIKILYLEYLVWGGYPKVILASSPEEKTEVLRDIAYSYIKKDVFEANIYQDENFYKLFKILANQVGNLVNSSELSKTLGISKTAIDNYLSVMQRSLHIKLVRPFFTNVRKELTKMPKVFFTDLGLRNFFKNDFNQPFNRDDKGQLLENAVYRQLLDTCDSQQIKFWRNLAQKEVDFIIEDKQLAYEVKVNSSSASLAKYRGFTSQYPKFVFQFISLNLPPKSATKGREPWQIQPTT
jgi:uncharacterized protein